MGFLVALLPVDVAVTAKAVVFRGGLAFRGGRDVLLVVVAGG